MGAVSARLEELGIAIPQVAKPVAAYVPAMQTDNLVYSSGQLPFVDGVLVETGKVGWRSFRGACHRVGSHLCIKRTGCTDHRDRFA
jgi:Putative translation initiation inhibitor, yjgF family